MIANNSTNQIKIIRIHQKHLKLDLLLSERFKLLGEDQ